MGEAEIERPGMLSGNRAGEETREGNVMLHEPLPGALIACQSTRANGIGASPCGIVASLGALRSRRCRFGSVSGGPIPSRRAHEAESEITCRHQPSNQDREHENRHADHQSNSHSAEYGSHVEKFKALTI
jgi:hypothetical protein